jgi:hypothetical protein
VIKVFDALLVEIINQDWGWLDALNQVAQESPISRRLAWSRILAIVTFNSPFPHPSTF